MEIIQKVVGQDGVSAKYLQRIDDRFVVETAYIDQARKHILCVSTQVGCVIGCKFCTSGLRLDGRRYERSLSVAEIVAQCKSAADEIVFGNEPKPLLFSFMGEGEPFLNFEDCVGAFHELSCMSWPTTIRFAISTSGIRPHLIKELALIRFPVPLKLQVSIHAPTDAIRARLIPATRPLDEILSAVDFFRKESGRPVDLMYVLCKGVNDDIAYAESFAQLLARYGSDWHVKFNRLNSSEGMPFESSSPERLSEFRAILERNGVTTEYYETDEPGIGLGCGQLAYRHAK